MLLPMLSFFFPYFITDECLGLNDIKTIISKSYKNFPWKFLLFFQMK